MFPKTLRFDAAAYRCRVLVSATSSVGAPRVSPDVRQTALSRANEIREKHGTACDSNMDDDGVRGAWEHVNTSRKGENRGFPLKSDAVAFLAAGNEERILQF